MGNIVIAAGDIYTDIDVLACAVAYHNLLELQNLPSLIVLPGPFNKSITDSVKKWNFQYETEPKNEAEAVFVIVDISEPDHIAKFVDQNKIFKLFDHHYGFEKYWFDKYGEDAVVEKVGACATLIWESFKKAGFSSNISTVSSNLLTTAIVSNTLNFKAAVTTERDIVAYNELTKFNNLPTDWTEIYFKEQEKFTFEHPFTAAKEDTISISVNEFEAKLTICQIELWNSNSFMKVHLNEAVEAVKSYGNDFWFITSPSISEGKNYIYSENGKVKSFLENLLRIKFDKNFAVTDKLILRKEIKKLIYTSA